jgi:hypothetical protein
MKLVRIAIVALTFALAGGSALAKGEPAPKKPDTGAALTEQDKADIQKWLAFFDKLVDIVVADKDDCAKMAGDLNKLIDANKDLIQKASDAVSAGKKLPEDAQKHMMASAQKMGPAMQKCGNDKAVQAAFMRMMPKAKPAK